MEFNELLENVMDSDWEYATVSESYDEDEISTLTKTAKRGSGKISDSYDFNDLNSLVNPFDVYPIQT